MSYHDEPSPPISDYVRAAAFYAPFTDLWATPGAPDQSDAARATADTDGRGDSPNAPHRRAG